MRITMNSLNRHMQNVIQNRYGDMAKLQEQMSSGKRLLRPSDDPIDTTNDIKLKSKIVQINQFKKNIEDGLGFMSVSDTAMVSMNDVLQRVRELAIQGSSDSLTSPQRKMLQKETEQLLRQIVALSNTNYKGDYVFAGTQTKIEPFPQALSAAAAPLDYTQRKMTYFDSSAGVGGPYQIRDAFTNDAVTRIIPGTLTLAKGATKYLEGTDFTVNYVNGTITTINPALAVDLSDGGTFGGGAGNYSANGFQLQFEYYGQAKDIYGDPVNSRGEINREVEPNIKIPINIPGEELLKDPVTGTHAIDVLIDLNQQLLNGTSANVRTAKAKIDIAFNTVLSAQARNGSRTNRFETTLDRNEGQNAETTRLQSNLEDAEMAKTVTDFSLTESVYNAALKSASRVIQPSLVDFL